jgi:hypothetical protein
MVALTGHNFVVPLLLGPVPRLLVPVPTLVCHAACASDVTHQAMLQTMLAATPLAEQVLLPIADRLPELHTNALVKENKIQ